ncbi:MAG: phage tail protein [Nitrospinota bacterium]|nr:phage tail protein [Nitrospinota bacterium]
MIVDSGLQHIADQLSDQGQVSMSHMAVGTGTSAEAASQTALQTESARVALTSKTRSDKKVVYVGDFPAGVGTGALTEVGLLNAASAGALLSRVVFPVKNKGPSDTLKIIIEHTYARG